MAVHVLSLSIIFMNECLGRRGWGKFDHVTHMSGSERVTNYGIQGLPSYI